MLSHFRVNSITAVHWLLPFGHIVGVRLCLSPEDLLHDRGCCFFASSWISGCVLSLGNLLYSGCYCTSATSQTWSVVVREVALRQRPPHFRCIAGVSELGLRQPQGLPHFCRLVYVGHFCCSVSFFTTATAAAAFSHIMLECRVISSVNCATAPSEAADGFADVWFCR